MTVELVQFSSIVSALVNSGTITLDQSKEIVSTNGGNFTAKAQEWLAAGSINQTQCDEIISAGGGNVTDGEKKIPH